MGYKDREKQRAFAREWMRSRRWAWFFGKRCFLCGSYDNLQLHHHDQSAKVTHAVWSWSRARREEELAKCDAVCGDCHKSISAAQRARPLVHGSARGYKRGCRCPECREAIRARAAAYRQRKQVGPAGSAPATFRV